MEATVHTVAVGATNGSLLFFPDTITAAVGDVVQFQFHPANHSVTESDFGTPCQPKSSGFYSGFNPVAATALNIPTFSITINSTDPLFFYCAQGRHCEDGMVGAININPLSGDTLEAYRAAAAALDASTSSASPSTSISSSVSITSSPTATSTNQGSTIKTNIVQPTSSPNPPASSTSASMVQISTKGLSGGLIAGIVLGAAVIILAAFGLWILWRRTRLLERRLQPNVLAKESEPREGQEMMKVQELETRERPLELAGSGDGPRYELLDHEIGR